MLRDKLRQDRSGLAVASASGLASSPDCSQGLRFVQVEITTICNFNCFYCAGRDMPQKHMNWELFAGILECQPNGPLRVSLQGEGEPTIHPLFWDMATLVARRGYVPYTITNGSNLDAERAADLFPEIGVSLDTLDPGEAHRIGRNGIQRVLRNLNTLIEVMGAERIIIHTVAYGQRLGHLRSFLRALGITKHVIQPLQTKADYGYRYRRLYPHSPGSYHYHCRYVNERFMKYYDINGREMPCCFIKDASLFESTEIIRTELIQRRVPQTCIGCREISGS